MNSVPNVDFFTAVYCFDEHAMGVDPNTENKPVIDITVTLACPWPACINTWMYNSSIRGSVNLSSISSLKYAY